MKKNRFKIAVEKTEDTQNYFQNGLQALGKYSLKVKLTDNSKCEGSVDIDACTTSKYPQANRWDYVFSYDSKIYFIEVHSADTSEVGVVLKKLQWLKEWLNQKAPLLNQLKPKSFCWIQSNGYHILKNSKQERLLAQNGIRPIAKLTL
jgi:hypothetical protein